MRNSGLTWVFHAFAWVEYWLDENLSTSKGWKKRHFSVQTHQRAVKVCVYVWEREEVSMCSWFNASMSKLFPGMVLTSIQQFGSRPKHRITSHPFIADVLSCFLQTFIPSLLFPVSKLIRFLFRKLRPGDSFRKGSGGGTALLLGERGKNIRGRETKTSAVALWGHFHCFKVVPPDCCPPPTKLQVCSTSHWRIVCWD